MKYSICLLFLIIISINRCFSQDNTQESEYYKLFDSLTRYKNKGVFNGLEYIDGFLEFPTKAKDNNKFYGSYNFIKGNIVYNNQPYFDVVMKYDILNDLVLLEFVNKKVNLISLSSELISEFKVLGAKFIRLEKNSTLNSYYKNGFFKEAYLGNGFSFYVKYNKEKTKDLSKKKVYYSFKEHRFYFVHYKNAFYKVNSKRDVIKLLPHLENQIRDFFKKNPILFRSNKERFLTSLFKYLDSFNTESIK